MSRAALILLSVAFVAETVVATHSYNAWANKYYTEKKASQGKLRDYYYKLWQGAKKKAETNSALYKSEMAKYTAAKKQSESDSAKAAGHLKQANAYKKQADSYSAQATKYKGFYDAAVKAAATNKALYEKYLAEAKKHAAAAASNLAKHKAAKKTEADEKAKSVAQAANAVKLAAAGVTYAAQAKAEQAKAAASKKQADANKVLADKYYKLYMTHKEQRDFAYKALHHNGEAYKWWKQQGIYKAHATFNKEKYHYTKKAEYLTKQKYYEKLYQDALKKYNSNWSAHQEAKKKVKPEDLFDFEGYPDLDAIEAETDYIDDAEE